MIISKVKIREQTMIIDIDVIFQDADSRLLYGLDTQMLSE